MTPIITAQTSSSLSTLLYSVIKWFVNRQKLLLGGHLTSCDKTYTQHHDLSINYWEMVFDAHQGIQQNLGSQPWLGILEGTFMPRNSNTVPGPSLEKSWTYPLWLQVTFNVKEDSMMSIEWCEKRFEVLYLLYSVHDRDHKYLSTSF